MSGVLPLLEILLTNNEHVIFCWACRAWPMAFVGTTETAGGVKRDRAQHCKCVTEWCRIASKKPTAVQGYRCFGRVPAGGRSDS